MGPVIIWDHRLSKISYPDEQCLTVYYQAYKQVKAYTYFLVHVPLFLGKLCEIPSNEFLIYLSNGFELLNIKSDDLDEF